MDQDSVIQRGLSAAKASIRPALRTTRFLLTVMVPVSLAVTLLDESGFLRLISKGLDPAMACIGLPGASSLVFLSAMLLNNYSAIAVIGTLDLSARAITILAVMCLIAHNLIVECAVMKKTGSSATKMAFLRISVALIAAFLLNMILPGVPNGSGAAAAVGSLGFPLTRLPSILAAWAVSSGGLMLKIAILVTLLMVAQKLMEEFGLVDLLGKLMSPLMILFGLPVSTSFLWIVSNVIGLSYGSAILIERTENGKLSLSDGDLFNHHAGISHSLLEDSILFFAIGVPLFWLIVPRLILAIAVVWLERLRRILFRRSFRVGTI